jgi:hypothetical protein
MADRTAKKYKCLKLNEEINDKKKKRVPISNIESINHVQSQQDSRQLCNELTPPRNMAKKGSRASLPEPL